jgi:hypothetical protein
MRQTKTRPLDVSENQERMRPYQVVAGTQQRAVARDGDARDAHVFFRDELVRALVLAQVPDADGASAVTADELALVRVDDDVIDGGAVVVVALNGAGADVPYLDGAVLGACNHPLALAMESDGSDVGRVALE